jgi:hypothetical protein
VFEKRLKEGRFAIVVKLAEKDEVTLVKYEFANELIRAMELDEAPLCISLYQPTHRHSPGNLQDPIVFKNSIREIEGLLKQKYEKSDIQALMKPFYQIEAEKNFWNHTLDGLAILASADKCIVYRLNRTVLAQVVVADTFHLKPLIRNFQSTEKYQVLGLSRSEFVLFEGNRDGLTEVEFEPQTLRTIEQVLGDQLTESYLTFGTYGDGGGTAMFHGHGGKNDEIDKDTEKFFRYVDGFVAEKYSKPYRLPLILLAVAEHHNVFKKVSNNPFLLTEGIKGSYNSLSMDQLTAKAWKVAEPFWAAQTQKTVSAFARAKVNETGSDNLAQIVKAILENRVETLLVEAFKVWPGTVNQKTGEIEPEDLDNSTQDILDDLTEMTLKRKGEVLVLPKDQMPGDTGVAAIYRY